MEAWGHYGVGMEAIFAQSAAVSFALFGFVVSWSRKPRGRKGRGAWPTRLVMSVWSPVALIAGLYGCDKAFRLLFEGFRFPAAAELARGDYFLFCSLLLWTGAWFAASRGTMPRDS